MQTDGGIKKALEILLFVYSNSQDYIAIHPQQNTFPIKINSKEEYPWHPFLHETTGKFLKVFYLEFPGKLSLNCLFI
jgi:hypothetical protein